MKTVKMTLQKFQVMIKSCPTETLDFMTNDARLPDSFKEAAKAELLLRNYNA